MGKKKTYPEYPLTLGEGLLNAGTGTVDSLDPELTYSLGDMTQLDLFSEHDMRDKYHETVEMTQEAVPDVPNITRDIEDLISNNPQISFVIFLCIFITLCL